MTTSPQRSPTEPVQAVARAADLLACFVGEETGITLTQLSKQTGLHTTTAHRLLRTLVIKELLTHDPERELYSVGPLLAALGRAGHDHGGLGSARLILEQLVHRTGESAGLNIRRGAKASAVTYTESLSPLRFSSFGDYPLHVAAAGKILMAFSGTPATDEVASLGHLEALTPNSITDPAALVAALQAVAQQGYAIGDEESDLGVRSLAVPVFDANDHAAAAVAIFGPVARLTDERVPELVEHLRDAATTLRRVLRTDLLGTTS